MVPQSTIKVCIKYFHFQYVQFVHNFFSICFVLKPKFKYDKHFHDTFRHAWALTFIVLVSKSKYPLSPPQFQKRIHLKSALKWKCLYFFIVVYDKTNKCNEFKFSSSSRSNFGNTMRSKWPYQALFRNLALHKLFINYILISLSLW